MYTLYETRNVWVPHTVAKLANGCSTLARRPGDLSLESTQFNSSTTLKLDYMYKAKLLGNDKTLFLECPLSYLYREASYFIALSPPYMYMYM